MDVLAGFLTLVLTEQCFFDDDSHRRPCFVAVPQVGVRRFDIGVVFGMERLETAVGRDDSSCCGHHFQILTCLFRATPNPQ